VLVLLLLSVCVAFAFHINLDGPLDQNGIPKIPCATQEAFEYRNQESLGARACTVYGACDDPAYRAQHGSGNTPLQLRMVVHVMLSAAGRYPDDITATNVQNAIDRVVQNYGSYGVQIAATVVNHNDAAYYCIPGYSGSNSAWLTAIEGMKTKYAQSPTTTVNIFISCQDFSLQGTLFGIGTFPWDTIALTSKGGLWLNSITATSAAYADGDTTFAHELGHCLGLWHTFHGTAEILGCDSAQLCSNGCCELPHPSIDSAANTEGDRCADTPATPRNYNCANPGTTACNGVAFGTTDYTNFMGYGMEPRPCGDHFSDQQKERLRCYTCDVLSGWVINQSAC